MWYESLSFLLYILPLTMCISQLQEYVLCYLKGEIIFSEAMSADHPVINDWFTNTSPYEPK